MKPYGEVIREIRMSKGVSQKAVYSNIISKSYAIEFEKGTHDISLRLFEQILERLMLSIDEFYYIYRGYRLSKQDEILEKYAEAGNLNDLGALTQLYKELLQQEDTSYEILLAEVRSRIRLLQNFKLTNKFDKTVILAEDIEIISQHLNNVQTWTLQDMRLFTNTSDYIDYEQKVVLFKTLIKSMKKYETYDRGRAVICALLTNMIYELLISNELLYAEVLIEDLNLISHHHQELFFKIVCKYYRGILKIKMNEGEEGIRLARLAIEMLIELDQPHQAKIFEAILLEVL